MLLGYTLEPRPNTLAIVLSMNRCLTRINQFDHVPKTRLASPEDLKGGSARRVPRTLPDTVYLGAFVPVVSGGVDIGAWCARKINKEVPAQISPTVILIHTNSLPFSLRKVVEFTTYEKKGKKINSI